MSVTPDAINIIHKGSGDDGLLPAKLPRESSKPYLAYRKFVEFFFPPSVSDGGCSRLISIEFTRGIAIFIMIVGHEALTSLSLEERTSPVLWRKLLFYALVTPIGVLTGWRSIFVLLSGIGMGYSFFQKITYPNPRHMVAQTLLSLLGCVLLLPLYYVYHTLQVLSYQDPLGDFKLATPFYTKLDTLSQAPIFFGLSLPLTLLVLLALYLCIGFPLRKRLSQERILVVIAVVCTVIACLQNFLFSYVSLGLRHLFSRTWKYENIPAADWPIECPANKLNQQTLFGAHIQSIFMHFLAGEVMQVNPLFSYFFVGFAYAAMLVRFKLIKKQLLDRDDREEAATAYQAERRRYIIMGWAYPAFWFLISVLVSVQARQELKSGLRSYVFDITMFLASQQPTDWCLVPEFSCPTLVAEIVLLNLGFYLFEFGTKPVTYVRTQRILFLRRFSSMSFTYFVFSRYLGRPMYSILRVSKLNSLTTLQFYGYMGIYFCVTLCIQLALDTIYCRLMPDWIIKRWSDLFMVKKSARTELSDNHLNVRPVILFGKVLE
ncbi:Transmembrane domain-containing protein [Spironucleus salmonicida]|uniref:Transmembrane domain-containing protein n=2 Tax=Spironucleus salmonicida TaxID=348837 RepID=A0A9P8LTB0_9EUKA|nr:Transmembrane domain-containing protein [Spironucleus salmonicida]